MNKKDKRKRLPVIYCPKCKEDTLAQIQKFIHKETQYIICLVSCPQCELCLNLDEPQKIRWWLEETVKKRLGWQKKDE